MSGGFLLNTLREEFSKRSYIVRGFPPGTNQQVVNNIFQGQCRRIQQIDGATWLISFQQQQPSHFLYPGNVFGPGNVPLQITPSSASDIPDSWLQDDQNNQAGASSQGNPPQGHQGYLVYPGQGYQGNSFFPQPPTSQGQYPHNSQNIPYFSGQGQQYNPPTGTPSKTPLGDGPQVVPTDPTSYKSPLEPTFYMNYPNVSMPGPQTRPPDHASNQSSFEPTVYANFPSMPMPGPVSSAPPPYENHDFAPQVPPRIPARKSLGFQNEAGGGGGGVQSSSVGSVMRGSDDADSMTQRRQVTMGHGQHFDPMAQKHQMNPTVYQNYPSGVSMAQPVTSAPPPYETHTFHTPQLPSKFPSKVSPRDAKGVGQSSSVESLNKSSDSAMSTAKDKTSDVTSCIKVSWLPPDIAEEFITDFFENSKRSGGGDVEDVAYDEKTNTAIITFQDPAVVKSVLKKHESTVLTMNDVKLQIGEYHPKTGESEEEVEVTAVKVTNLPPKISKEQIELFFESRKKSGIESDDLDKVDYDEAARCAIVWFKSSEVVTKVLEKHSTSPFMLNKQKVEVEEYRPAADEDESSSEEEEEGGGAIKVTRIPPEITEEEITLFFENRKKSGGGDVEKVDYDTSTHTAVIWFKENDVVSSVLQNVPLMLRKKQIHVEEVRLDGQKVEKEADVESLGSPCTIEVSGFKDTTSKDSVEFYFDNKRSGGGGVEEVKGEVEDEVLLITFDNEETVKRVLEKTHKLDGVELKVRQYQPPKPIPMYPNRVLVKGLNPETTEDGIRNYLEAKSGEDVIDVTFGQEEGTVLVTFEELKDFTKLEAACQKKPLEKRFLTVKRVPISNCIIVSGFSEGISDSTLEFYFENEKRSGGGTVTDIKVNHEDCTCLVYFEDHTVCDKVCKRSHVVEKQNLTVQIYHECLGQPFNPEEGPRFKCPSPLVLRELNLRKMKFIYKSEEFKTALDKQAEMAHGKIKWPQKPATELTVECLLTKTVKDSKNLAKTWETHMKDGLIRMLDVLHVEEISVLQELWQGVMDWIKQVNVSDPQKVAIVLEKGSFTVVLVGYGKVVEPLKKDLKQMISNMEEEIQRKKQQVTESKTLRHSEFLLLSFDHFKEGIEKKFPGLKVTTSLKDRKITFEGQYGDVTEAKISLLERCHQICEASAGMFSKYRRDYLSKKEVKIRVSKMLKEKDNMSCFEFKGDEVCLFAFSDDKAVEAAHLLKNEIAESPIEVPPESAYLLNSNEWEKQAKQIESMEQFESLLQLITLSDHKKIIIVTFCNLVGLAREFVEDFLQANTIISDSKNVPPGYFKYLEAHHKDKCQEISKRLREKQVQVTMSPYKFSVKGTRAGVAEAMRNLDEILKKIQSKKHILQKPGIGKYLKSDNGKSTIRKIERQNKCYIHIGEEDPTVTAIAHQPASFNGIMAEHKTKSGTFIKVHEGDLTALPVDVIVNGANSDLLHGGGLAAILVKKGGIGIQKECTEHVQKNGKLKEGDIYCSKPGDLSCKMIVHACGPTWKGGANQEKGRLMDCIQAALEETEKRGYRSIAVPALCTGIFGFPIKEATLVIVKAVKSFLKDKKDSKIKEVFLCDVKTNTVQCFTEALQQAYKSNVNVFKRNIHQASGPAQNLQRDVAKGHAPSLDVEFQAGPISVKLIKGQIAKSKVDVIVNTASKELNLKHGAVSASISNLGGDSIQQECKTKYPEGINFGEIAITGGGKLACKIVCHGALSQWDKGTGDSKNVLQKFLKSCLEESQKQNLSSIAFPAMGTGNLGYPRDMVAEEMCSSVLNFCKGNPNTSLKQVLFVVYEKDTQTIQAFETEIQKQAMKTQHKRGGKRHGTPNKPKEDEGFVVIPKDATSGASQKEVAVDMGNLKLRMYQGDITLADVDAIVNGTNNTMDLSKGGVSLAIKAKLGEQLQRQIEFKKTDMKNNGLAVTENGDKSPIPSKFIIHVDISGGHYKKKILEALNKVEELKLKTVAIPAIGTGNLYQQQTVEEFAEQVFSALNKMYSDVKHLSEVHVVIFDQQMAQKFILAMQQCFQSQDSKPKGWLMEKLANYMPKAVGGGKPHGHQWNPVVEDKDASKATIIVYGEGHDIDTGINRLENLLEGDFDTKEFKDEIIPRLSKTQMKALYDLKERFHIDVNIDKDKGMAVLHGTKDDISAASDVYHRIIRDAERNIQEGQQAKLISDYVQWYYVDNSDGKNELIEYPGNINLIIEKAYRNQDKEVRFTDDGGTEYTINFINMEEYPTVEKADVTTVTRRDKIKASTFELPSDWSVMPDSDNLAMVPVDSGSPIYSSVIDRFHGQVGKREIVKLERIQNKMLYQQYVAKKKLLESQNPKGTKNERELWHGTAPEAVSSINSLGFNRSYCGKNATRFGEGVYFALSANYSVHDTYSRPDSKGHKRMYLCKVLTGEYTVGQSGMRVPPAKKGQQSHILYDSVVDNVGNPSMFIIFNDTQGYPDYLITFK